MESVNVDSKFEQVKEHWDPAIIGEFNENHVKIARIKGDFVWHKHENEDELFYVLQGELIMKFRDKEVKVKPHEFIIVPKGVEHLPCTNGEEVKIMLIEPASTVNTGNIESDRTRKDLKRL